MKTIPEMKTSSATSRYRGSFPTLNSRAWRIKDSLRNKSRAAVIELYGEFTYIRPHPHPPAYSRLPEGVKVQGFPDLES